MDNHFITPIPLLTVVLSVLFAWISNAYQLGTTIIEHPYTLIGIVPFFIGLYLFAPFFKIFSVHKTTVKPGGTPSNLIISGIYKYSRNPLYVGHLLITLGAAIVAGFVGIGLILQPDERIFNMGAVWALLSGLCLATTLVTMRMASKKETLYSLMLYFFLIGLVVTTPFALADWKVGSWVTLLGLLAIGGLSALGQVLLYFGLKFGKAHQLAPFTYTTVIFSGFYEWLIWDHYPKPLAYLGMAIIIAAGIYIVWISAPKKEVK